VSQVEVFRPTRILSSSASGELLEDIQTSLDAGRTNILINLQNVMFMDISGLATLVLASKRVQTAAGRFALCGLNGQARMLVEQSGMRRTFEIYDNLEDFENVRTPDSDDR